MSRKPKRQQPKMLCPDCGGRGQFWSETSHRVWREHGGIGNPPDYWLDRNCQRCLGGRYLTEQGDPHPDYLTPGSYNKWIRSRKEAA